MRVALIRNGVVENIVEVAEGDPNGFLESAYVKSYDECVGVDECTAAEPGGTYDGEVFRLAPRPGS